MKVFSADSAKQLCDAVPEDDAKFFVSHWRGLSSAESIKEDIESLKARMLDEISIHLLNWIDEDATVCPICGSENTEPIAKLIKSRKAALTDKESELLSDYSKTHPNENAEEIQEHFAKRRQTRVWAKRQFSVLLSVAGERKSLSTSRLLRKIFQ